MVLVNARSLLSVSSMLNHLHHSSLLFSVYLLFVLSSSHVTCECKKDTSLTKIYLHFAAFFFFLFHLNYYYYHYTLCEFFTPVLTIGHHRNLNDSKFPWFSRILLCILANFSRAVAWTVPFLSWISSSPYIFFHVLWDCSKSSIHDWYHYHIHVL